MISLPSFLCWFCLVVVVMNERRICKLLKPKNTYTHTNNNGLAKGSNLNKTEWIRKHTTFVKTKSVMC